LLPVLMMQMRFEEHLDSAADVASGLVMPQPRMLLASPAAGSDTDEYQSTIKQNGQRIQGLL